MPGDRYRRRQIRQQRLQEIRARTSEYNENKPSLWDKSRNYVAMGVRGATGVGSSMGGPLGAAIAGAGELGAQTIEKRDKYNLPQAGLQAGIGAIPGSALFKAGSKIANVGRGAMFGSTAAATTQQFEQGPHVPTKEDVMGIGLGTVLGGGGGAIAGKFGLGSKRRASRVADDVSPPPPVDTATTPVPRPSPRELDPSNLDNIRRSTLQGVRDIRSNPKGVTPRQSQAIADNLEGRFGTPEAIDTAAGIRRNLPTRDLTRAEGVMQGRATDPISTRGRAVDLPDRNLADVTLAESRQLRRSSLQPGLDDVKPLTPEVTLGAKVKRSARGKKRKRSRGRKKPVKATQEVDEITEATPTPKSQLDDIDELAPQASTSTSSFSKVSESDLKFLAKRGDKEAIAELQRRNTRQSFSSEIGAVGDIKRLRFGDRIKSERGALDIEIPKSKAPTPITENAPAASRMLKKADSRTPGFLKSYQTWVGSRNAAKVEGIIKSRDFTGLDKDGLEGIKNFQQGLRGGKYTDIQNYFNNKHQQIQSAGVKLGFKENYLPQLWDNTAEEVQDAARKLGLKPKFAMASVLENYEKGLEIGLKPRFTKISELIGWYEQTANKAVADRGFFNWITEKGLIQPGGKVPRNGSWSPLNSEHFPVQKFKGQTKEYTQDLWAPKDVAGIINNYLEPPRGEILNKFAETASIAKNFAMSSGVPKTGINAHGFNVLVRNIMARGAKGGVEGAKFILNPKSAFKDLESNLGRAPFFMKHGLTLSSEGFEFGETSARTLTTKLDPVKHPLASKIANPLAKGQEKLLGVHGKYFEQPLFQEILPALKLRHVDEFFKELKSKGMSESAAARAASQATNDLYGGINWEGMGRSKDLQNLLRTLILAPDWLETNVRTGANIASAMRNPSSPQGIIAKRVGKNLLAAYASANVLNYSLSGKMMYENNPGHALDINMGEADGKTIYLRPFGTAADFARLPADAILSAFKKDLGQGFQILKNRLSLPASSALNLISQRNRFGRKIFGKDDFGREIPVGKQVASGLGELGDIVAPPYVQNPVKYALGDIGLTEAITGGIESPVRFSSKGAGGRKTRATRKGRRSR